MAPFTPASFPADGHGRTHCSYKTATALLCTVNLVGAFYILQLLSPLYLFSNSYSNSVRFLRQDLPLKVRYSEDQILRINEAVDIWKRSEPVELVKRVQQIESETHFTDEEMEALRQKLASDLSRRLEKLRAASNDTRQQYQALEQWRRKKLTEIRKLELKGSSDGHKNRTTKAAGMKHLLVAGWSNLLEDIGWLDLDPAMGQGEEIPTDFEIENSVLPGRTPLPECRAETHTDYDGAAVRWGLTFHVESAADCCQACIDQAKSAKPGQLKCNIWVYCPQEAGCYSPDIYEHKHQECWLKQADKPRVNFKGRYSPEYRRVHPTAPIVVPWASGVISS